MEKDLAYFKQTAEVNHNIVRTQNERIMELLAERKALKMSRDYYAGIVCFYGKVFGRVMEGK